MDSISIKKESSYTDTCKMKLNSKRGRCSRVIILQKSRTGSYGFTLQTYAFKNYKTNRAELLTYVDYVEVGGPAFRAGMKRGDVILSINDRSIEGLQHEQLVQLIRQSPSPLRLTVTFEDWCTRIDLNLRKLKLKQHLKEKYLELALLEREEKELLRKAGLWKDTSEEECCCLSDVSSSTDQFSPSFTHKRASFMCSSFSVLHDHSTRNRGYDSAGEVIRRRDTSNHRDRSYECHSLPIVRKKKHFLQNQVFTVCESVVKMGCFSRSSADIDATSVDDVALVCDLDASRTTDDDVERRPFDGRGQSKTWYGVPEMHREALLKRQRKTSEVAKWYYPIPDDHLQPDPSKSNDDSSSLRHPFVPAETNEERSPRRVLLSSSDFDNLSDNLFNKGKDLDGRPVRSTRSSCEARSSDPSSSTFEDLSFESQEFLNSLPSSASPAPLDDRGCHRGVAGGSEGCRPSKNLLTLYGTTFCDTRL